MCHKFNSAITQWKNEVPKPPETAVLGSINDGVALGALLLANFTIIFFPVLIIIRTFENLDKIRCQTRRDLRDQIKRILFMQKPNLEMDLEKRPSFAGSLLFVLCCVCCPIIINIILMFQISDYSLAFAVRYVCGFMFVYSGVMSMILACVSVFICLKPGYSTHIISLGIEFTQLLPLGFLRRIIVILESTPASLV